MQTVQWHNEEYTENVSWNGSMWGMSALVEIKDVCKVYNPGENEVRALDHVSLTIDEQEFVSC